MIGNFNALLFVLCIVGCYGFRISNKIDSKSFVEIQLDAEATCITNITLYSKANKRLFTTSPSEFICPLHCFFSKSGLLNEGGLNKILVNWTRTFFVLEEKENISTGLLPQLAIFQSQDSEGMNTRLDAIFHKIRTVNNHLEESCSVTDKATRNQLIMTSLREIQTAVYSQRLENQGVYIPSAENSQYLELAQDAGRKCMSKFNVAVFSMIQDYKSNSKDKNKNKNNVCTLHCLFSELGYLNENGLNQIWIDEYRKMYKDLGKLNYFEAVLETTNEVLPILNSYCSSNYLEVSENELEKAVDKARMELKKIRNESESESEEEN